MANNRFGSRILLGLAVTVSLNASPRPASADPTLAAPQAAASHEFCSVNFPAMPNYNKAQPTYYTAIFPIPDQDATYGALFAEYIAKKYSIQQYSGGACSHSNGSVSVLEKAMETQIGNAKEFGATNIMRTEWTPDKHQALMAELAKNPPAKPASTAPATTPSPSPSPATDAQQKAIAAQKPASNGASSAAAKPAASANG